MLRRSRARPARAANDGIDTASERPLARNSVRSVTVIHRKTVRPGGPPDTLVDRDRDVAEGQDCRHGTRTVSDDNPKAICRCPAYKAPRSPVTGGHGGSSAATPGHRRPVLAERPCAVYESVENPGRRLTAASTRGRPRSPFATQCRNGQTGPCRRLETTRPKARQRAGFQDVAAQVRGLS